MKLPCKILLALAAIQWIACSQTACGADAGVDAAITSWLAAQTNIQTWSADFVQTRSLKALTQPLKAHGHVWFSAPNQFRWELGQPPQTTAIRNANEMLVIYPKLKRAERYPLGEAQTGPWRDALSLLEAGFPRNRGDLDAKFRIASAASTNDVVTLGLEPKSAAARRMMPQIQIAFSATQHSLLATELQFADGSKLRNDFTNAVFNAVPPKDLFDAHLDDSYKITEPLKASSLK